MRGSIRGLLLGVLLLPALLGAAPVEPPGEGDTSAGAPPGAEVAFELQDPRIDESSGMAVSQLHDDIYYTHNDSGPDMTPDVFAVNSSGETVATLRIAGPGVEARDWEGMAIGEGPDGQPAMFVGDIGDNFDGRWPTIRVYRVPEPTELTDQTLHATTYTFTYDDGGRDAEGLMIDPRDNRLYITSKEAGGGVYAAPEELSAEGTNELTRVGPAPLFATGASFAPDGRTYIVRTYWNATVYDATDGVPGEATARLNLPNQEQGEAIAHTPDGSAVYVSSEGQHTPVWRLELTEEQGAPEPEPQEDTDSGEEPPEADAGPATDEQEAGLLGGATWGILLGGVVATAAIGGIVLAARRA
ncbi:hypothetical protein RIF23_07750 [Lipingzhangella sp. LS1_29]|uniref:WD40 repeat domain-containing protein n=1 Tax=Lipingzhangella rawalii TaxID=2055835 RepID=A0ABU2H5T1_9ACTN|nr:hypothetical protein [Lipingzhangella rawalii]MDS1270185.1 hypothetical protein [Lipingzhangella rawalii]